MRGGEILLGYVGERRAAVLMEDGVAEDLLIESDAPRPGTIYRARVTRLMKGQGGVFLDTPEGSAYLRAAKGFRQGDVCLVQVSGYAEPGKAVPVTDRLLFKSRYAIATPGAPGINISRAIRDADRRAALQDLAGAFAEKAGEVGLIVRSAAEDAPDDAIRADAEAMLDAAQTILADRGADLEKLLDGPGIDELAWRDWPPHAMREAQIDEALEEALSSRHALGEHAVMFVEATRAFVAIDVNTGSDGSQAAGLKANIAAARAIPRALRLRGLGGQIVVDFAPMPKKERRQVETALRAACRADATETALVGWTTLGHYELSRKRARPVLREVLS